MVGIGALASRSIANALVLSNFRVVTDRQCAITVWFVADGCIISVPGVSTVNFFSRNALAS